MQRHKFRITIAGLTTVVALTSAACSDDASDGAAPTTEADAPGTSAPDSTAAEQGSTTTALYPDGLRGVKYCEVLLLAPGEGGIVASVYNSMGHSDCPDDAWAELDPAAIATEFEALVARLNGPRYWTLDRIDSTMQFDAPVETFGTIEMFLAATLRLGPSLPDQTPYTERGVDRETVFSFDAGTQIYELTSPEGRNYVMQSFSQQIDPTMNMASLATLGDRLDLPEGWTYQVITLDSALDLYSSDGVATVVQDEFNNTYQRIDSQV